MTSEQWLQENKLHECLVLSASISKCQCAKNKKYYKTGLDRGYITTNNPVKYKRSFWCAYTCNGLSSTENKSPELCTLL